MLFKPRKLRYSIVPRYRAFRNKSLFCSLRCFDETQDWTSDTCGLARPSKSGFGVIGRLTHTLALNVPCFPLVNSAQQRRQVKTCSGCQIRPSLLVRKPTNQVNSIFVALTGK
jgi:hypothetical protein